MRFGEPLQVLKPWMSSYEPLGLYPVETTGGTLQQASLWLWVAGMVDMLAVEKVVFLLEERCWGRWPDRDGASSKVDEGEMRDGGLPERKRQ